MKKPGAPASGFTEYVVDVRIAIRASDEFEAHELISRAVLERIDGHLLAAQRQARALSASVDDGLLVDSINALHAAVQAYDDATVTLEPPKCADALREAVFNVWWHLQQGVVRP